MTTKSQSPPLANIEGSEPDWDYLDRYAWEAILGWPREAGFDTQHDELDFSELTRWFLWDKVGRAVRKQVTPTRFALEVEELGWEHEPRGVLTHLAGVNGTWQRLGRLKYEVKVSLRRRRIRHLYQNQVLQRSTRESRPVIFLPVPTDRLLNTVHGLLESGDLAIYAPESQYLLDDVVRVPYPKGLPKADTAFSERLHAAILEGLARQGICLLTPDVDTLKAEIDKQQVQLLTARAYLDDVNPDMLLLSADNHPTHQHYVLLGRNRRIPSVMLQHGLDCERFYLDNAYATAIAVWGINRKQRYTLSSNWQPEHIEVTGNPQYDNLAIPKRMSTGGDYWLWVTRPHASVKCYSPSRSPWEAVDILNALLDALLASPGKQLVIKPHPCDTIALLATTLANANLGHRARIADKPPMELMANASVVISEDSTAGMEAMLLGKPLVHAHFAPTKPTMAFASYGAALPGFHPEQLAESIALAEELSPSGQAQMLSAQRRFIEDHAGPCDGNAAARVRAFIFDVLGTRHG